MSVTSVHKDFDSLTLTVEAEFDAPIDRVWQLWADPRQLERWWGPPTFPASFTQHSLTPGSESRFVMTGPNGEQSRGWWHIAATNPPHSLEFSDGFAAEDGTPITDGWLTTVRVELTEHAGRTRMTVHSTFSSRDHMEQIDKLGAAEAFVACLNQIDALLAA